MWVEEDNGEVDIMGIRWLTRTKAGEGDVLLGYLHDIRSRDRENKDGQETLPHKI